MSVLVHRPGMLTTIQDLGRWGHQSSGVPVAGPMDPWSHRLANALIGNADDAAVLEVTVTGPVLECEADTHVAITGAPFALRINGERVESPLVLRAPRGTTIDFEEGLGGSRAYVAIAGGFDVPMVLGSRSTDLRARFGGFHGRALRAGDRLTCGGSEGRASTVSQTDIAREGGVFDRLGVTRVPAGGVRVLREGGTRLRVVRGPSQGPRADAAFSELVSRDFHVSSRSDRMGYRLEGAKVDAGTAGTLITAPTVMGLVQVPPSGEPILLMADRQTTGGYAAMAVVITADLPLAGQLGPGHAVAFDACTHEAARRALQDDQARLAAVEALHG